MTVEIVARVSLSVALDHAETVVLPIADHMRAAAIALRRFRQLGYQVFAPGAIVEVELSGAVPFRASVGEVIAWLKEPEQRTFVEQQQSAEM